eukprot:1646575-Rhodomonas_salina.2
MACPVPSAASSDAAKEFPVFRWVRKRGEMEAGCQGRAIIDHFSIKYKKFCTFLYYSYEC